MNNIETVYLDTETTGLNGSDGDEILEISIVDDHGYAIINSLVRPTKVITWVEAQCIHGISPNDVADAPSLESLMPSILDAIAGKTIVIYNASFDVTFFPRDTFNASTVECCMLRFAERIGVWNDYRNSYRWHKLGAAAAHVGHEWSGEAHRALADTLATRSVWHWLEAGSTEPKIDDDTDSVPF